MIKLSTLTILQLIFVGSLQLAVADLKAKEMPMWQGFSKSTAQRKADKEFVDRAVSLAKGDANEAARRGVAQGWKEISKGNPEKAMRRFNQAWLINPKRGDIYWGFAIALSVRGDDIRAIEQWFSKAEDIAGPNWRLHSDWGRVLEQRNKPKAAIAHFLKSIEMNPNNPEPHIGMIKASQKLRDTKTANKHLKIYQALTN